MAGRGPAPQPNLRTDHGKRRAAEFVSVTSDGQVRGPDLPEGDWPQATRALYESLRRSPMAQTWLDVDWFALHDLAILHAAYVSGELRHAPELRLRLAQFGVTPEARLRLRLMVEESSPTESKLEALRRRHAEARAKYETPSSKEKKRA